MATKGICADPECRKQAHAKGLCWNHYMAHRRATNPKCTIEDCSKPQEHRGLCCAHLARLERHGHPLAGGTSKGALSAWLVAHKDHDSDECLIWPYGRTTAGYGALFHKGKRATASRVMCELVNGPPAFAWYDAAHICGKGHEGCVNPRHLVWKSPKDNHADKLNHGTLLRGEDLPQSKLTEHQVITIYELRDKLPASHIARMFGVTGHAVSRIHDGTTWGWLTQREGRQ